MDTNVNVTALQHYFRYKQNARQEKKERKERNERK
jgi:hypothetical protein